VYLLYAQTTIASSCKGVIKKFLETTLVHDVGNELTSKNLLKSLEIKLFDFCMREMRDFRVAILVPLAEVFGGIYVKKSAINFKKS